MPTFRPALLLPISFFLAQILEESASCGFGDIDLSPISGRELVLPLKPMFKDFGDKAGYDLRICGDAATECTDPEFNWPPDDPNKKRFKTGMLVETIKWAEGSGVCKDPCLSCFAEGTYEGSRWSAVPNGVRVSTGFGAEGVRTNVTFICNASVELPDPRDLEVNIGRGGWPEESDWKVIVIPTKYACPAK